MHCLYRHTSDGIEYRVTDLRIHPFSFRNELNHPGCTMGNHGVANHQLKFLRWKSSSRSSEDKHKSSISRYRRIGRTCPPFLDLSFDTKGNICDFLTGFL